jgi:hypothetical protein
LREYSQFRRLFEELLSEAFLFVQG